MSAVHVCRDILYQVLGSRYVMYGEWMYAKHSVFYDALPHYFLEFDILDRKRGCFLDTPSRRKLTCQMPVASVPGAAGACGSGGQRKSKGAFAQAGELCVECYQCNAIDSGKADSVVSGISRCGEDCLPGDGMERAASQESQPGGNGAPRGDRQDDEESCAAGTVRGGTGGVVLRIRQNTESQVFAAVRKIGMKYA